MNYRNSRSKTFHSIGEHRLIRFAAGDEEEVVVPAEEEVTEVVTPPEGEAEAEVPVVEDEDPLNTPNPYEEGKPEHDAFERQRQKFKTKLETEVKAAAAEATAALSAKFDDLLAQLGPLAKPKEETPVVPAEEEGQQITDEDVRVVTGALKKVGLDPETIVRDRRRTEVNTALSKLRTEYPDAQFDDLELVKYANTSGLNRVSNDPFQILELALLSKLKDGLKKKPGTPAIPVIPKKEPVPVLNNGTKKQPVPADDKPKGEAGWRQHIFRKRGVQK